MNYKISKIAVLLFLPLMVTACQKGIKNAEPVRQFDWGEVRFNIEKPASQISAKLKRFFRGSKPVLGLNIKLSSGYECRQFKLELDSDSPRFQDRYRIDWTLAKPSGEGLPCLDEPGGASVSEAEFKSILSGAHSDLQIYGNYILTESEAAIVPDLPPASNIGSRSLMMIVMERHESTEYPVVALIDLETKKINGLAIQSNWIEDARTEEFPKQFSPAIQFRPVQLDFQDAAYLSQRCRLELNYVRALRGPRDARRAELLKDAVKNINIPSKECP